jgi:hypothetical protein
LRVTGQRRGAGEKARPNGGGSFGARPGEGACSARGAEVRFERDAGGVGGRPEPLRRD